MTKKLLKNLRLINPCSEPAFIENAFVAISGDTIESAGNTLPKGEFDEVHDLGGKFAPVSYTHLTLPTTPYV